MVWPGVAAGIGSGLLLWLASPAVGAGWLAWVALTPAAAVALRWRDSRGGRLAVPLAYAVYLELILVPALPFGLADGQFAHIPVPVLIGGTPVLLVALVAVPVVCLGLYAVRFGQAPAGVHPALLVAAPALAFTALDFARVQLDPGGLFGPLFASQHDTAVAAASSVAGPWLVTALIAMTGYGLALAVVRGRFRLAVLGAVAVVAAGAAAALAGPPSTDGSLRVAAIQPGYDTAEDDRPELRWFRPGTYDAAALDTIRDLGGLTAQAAREGAELVVWPEAAVWVDPAGTPAVRAALTRLTSRTDVTLVVPFFVRDLRQSATVVVAPSGRISTPRPKQRPMWFLGEDGGNAARARPVHAAGVEIGTALGVDTQAPGVAGGLVRDDAALLVSSTHDWEQSAVHHGALTQLIAAATGAPVIRADWRHGSAIYAGGGRKLADAGTAKRRAIVTATVAPGGGTPYTAIGDTLAWAALAATVAAWAATGLRRRGGAGRRRALAPSVP